MTADRTIDENAGNAAQEEGGNRPSVELQPGAVLGGVSVWLSAAKDIKCDTKLDANVGGHAGDMRGPNPGIGNSRHGGILQSHQKRETKGQEGRAPDCQEPDVG